MSFLCLRLSIWHKASHLQFLHALQEQAVRWWKLSISKEHWPRINMLFAWMMLCSHWCHVYCSLRDRLGKSVVLTVLLPQNFHSWASWCKGENNCEFKRGREREITVWDQKVISRKALKMSAQQSRGDRWRLTCLECDPLCVYTCTQTAVPAGSFCDVWVGRAGQGRGRGD